MASEYWESSGSAIVGISGGISFVGLLVMGSELVSEDSSGELFEENSLRNLKDGIVRGGRETRRGLGYSEYNTSDRCKQLTVGCCIDWSRLTILIGWDSADARHEVTRSPSLIVGNSRATSQLEFGLLASNADRVVV